MPEFITASTESPKFTADTANSIDLGYYRLKFSFEMYDTTGVCQNAQTISVEFWLTVFSSALACVAIACLAIVRRAHARLAASQRYWSMPYDCEARLGTRGGRGVAHRRDGRRR